MFDDDDRAGQMTHSRDVHIVDGTAELLCRLERLDYSYEVEEVAAPPFNGDDIASTVTCTPYCQAYEFDARSLAGHLQGLDRAVFVALSGGQPIGFIAVEKSWSNLAAIADLAVARNSRRRSVGRRLMDAAVSWARNQELRGIRLETQSNNLTACRFYASYGFRLGGFDRLLYRGIKGAEVETALFWYLFLDAGIDEATSQG